MFLLWIIRDSIQRGWQRGRGSDRGRGARGGRGFHQAAPRQGQQHKNTVQQRQTEQPLVTNKDAAITSQVEDQATKAAGKRKMDDTGTSLNVLPKTIGLIEAMGEPPAEGSKEGERNKKKDWCFRCRTKGHVSAVCSTELFCQVRESNEHVAASCPIKRKPKPVAHAVGYAVDNLGFYHIPMLHILQQQKMV